jgi:hypothetical protein
MTYLFSNTSSIFQSNGTAISNDNPLAVTLGGANITIQGNTNIISNVEVTNFPNVQTVNGNVNATVIGSVTVSGITSNVNVNPITGNVGVIGNVNVNPITGNVGISGNVNVNPITGNVTVIGLGNLNVSGNTLPVSGNVNVTVLLGGNIVSNTNPFPITGNITATVSGISNVSLGTGSVDAFGRLRVSEPFTLFDTSARYYDHGQFSNDNVGTANVVYVASQSSFQLNVGSANGDSVIRESKRVFAYQPGKSQLTMNTFCFATPKTNLRQRVGLFGASNGVYFENDGTYNYMVIRSGSTGVEERVRQDAWNGDRLNPAYGNNPSGITLYPDRTQIFYADVEWLGVGSVRVGFVIEGKYLLCHSFHHANEPGNTKVYMTTATLPIRYEITNTGPTSGPSMMTQICSTVISEGGYNQFGITESAGTGTSTVRLTTAGTYYPIVSIRLNSGRLDSIVLPRQIDILSPSINYYRWVLLQNATLTGATWATTSASGTVDIDLAATAVTGGTQVQAGLASSRELTSLAAIDYFQYQIGRTVTGVSDTVTLALAATANNADVLAELGWQELS